MGSNSCLASFLALSARLARCSKQLTAWLHRYAKKCRNILAWLSGAPAGSPGRFFLLLSATIKPPRATASALASPWLRRGGSPPPETASRAAPGRRGGSPRPSPASRVAPGWPLPKSDRAGFLRHRYDGLPRRLWLASPSNTAVPASSSAATAVPCTDFATQACARPLFLLRNARCRPPPRGPSSAPATRGRPWPSPRHSRLGGCRVATGYERACCVR
jgi:hypothetical protein